MSSINFGDFPLSEIEMRSLGDSNGMLIRPMEVSVGTIKRLYFVRPLRDACNRLQDIVLDAFQNMIPGEQFYRDNDKTPPEDDALWSKVLNGAINGEAKAIIGVIDALKVYAPNDTPFHSQAFREMDVCIKQKIYLLANIFNGKTKVFERCKTIYEAAIASLSIHYQNYTIEERNRDLDRLKKAYDDIDKWTVEFLIKFEDERLYPGNAVATKKDVGQLSEGVQQIAVDTSSIDRKADAIQTTVKRIDSRDLASRGEARKQKRVEKNRVQDATAEIVEKAKNDYELRKWSKSGKFSFEACFTNQHYRDELQKLGIGSVAMLQSIVRARNNRLYRERQSTLV